VGLLVRRSWTIQALAFVLAGAFALCATPVAALPAATSTAAEAKQAQAAAASAAAEAKRMELDTKVAEYVSIGRELGRTRDQVSELAIKLAAGELKLAAARSALTSRAVELYRAPRIGMVEVFIGTSSLQDLFARIRYLAIISEHDARLMRDYRLTLSENLFLQQSLADQEANLTKLQEQADEQRKQIEKDVAAREAQAKVLGSDATRLAAAAAAAAAASVVSTGSVYAGGTPTGKFVPETVISQTNFRAATSMSAADIQAFLQTQPGALKSYVGKGHSGAQQTAAQMIAEASVNFNVSPKVILATLQKEQSLLSAKSPSQSQYDGAMGAGMPDSGSIAGEMQGFGNQVWWGAQKQNKNALDWHQGAFEPVDGTNIYPTNEGTFAQYRYTPHTSGVMSFWMIYWRYFGDPLS